mmetsp:Transcript_7209/g.15423  ORF Transcript_7209/g.15423 Transcript_7209/m.15423 type:complete len:87 (+) Transcript_7209:167-427(+)
MEDACCGWIAASACAKVDACWRRVGSVSNAMSLLSGSVRLSTAAVSSPITPSPNTPTQSPTRGCASWMRHVAVSMDGRKSASSVEM